MQVQSINNVNFKKKRYIPQAQLSDIRDLVYKMNREGVYTEKGMVFSNTVTGALKKDDVFFTSSHIYYANPIPEEYLLKLKSRIEIGKNAIDVDNLTGEIISLKKGFFKSTNKLLDKIGEYLEIFNKNFNNSDVVEKKHMTVHGFTDGGAAYISKLTGLS